MNFFFRNIRLIDPASKRDEILNIHIQDGKFEHIGKSEPSLTNDTKIIDGNGLVISPGLIDIHVHLREPGFEYKEDIKSGTESAANGGFTSVVCMPNTKPDIDTLDTVNYIKEKSKDNIVNVLISAGITRKRAGEELTNFEELHKNGVVLFTDDGYPVSNSQVMRLAFEEATKYDLMLSQHCEDTELTTNFIMNEGEVSEELGLKGYPKIAEEVILFRDIKLAEYCGNRRYHAQHLSSKGSIEIVRQAKKRNLRVTCEVAPHHFTLSDNNLRKLDANYKMNPPLRTDDDIAGIIEGIKDGTIDCIATDHAPHSPEEKSKNIENTPNGIIGLETSLGLSITYLVHTGHIDLYKLVELMATNPRIVIKIEHPKFEIGENVEATIFDPNEEWTVNKDNFKSKSINSPYNGYKLKGKPKYIFNNNRVFESNL